MKLPNGWQVSANAEMEGMFIYNEIFKEDCYGKHGIKVADGDAIVDVGANVGQNSSPCLQSPPNRDEGLKCEATGNQSQDPMQSVSS